MSLQLRYACVLGIGLGILTGCSNPDASDRQETQAKINKAVAMVEQATAGYGIGLKPGQSALDYREAVLNEVVANLSPLKSGTPAQQSAARALLASAYASLGQMQENKAVKSWALVSAQAGSLIADAVAVQRAQYRADSLVNDETAAAEVFARFGQSSQTAAGGAGELAAKLQAENDVLRGQAGELVKQRDALLKQAQEVRAQAFVVEGAAASVKRYDLNIQALKLERQSQELGAKADTLGIQIAVNQARLEGATREQQLATSSAQATGELAQAAQGRTSDSKTAVDEVYNSASDPLSMVSLAKTMSQKIEAVGEAFEKTVNEPYVQAEKSLQSAISAVPAGGGTQMQKLAALAARADLLYGWAGNVETLQRYLDTVSGVVNGKTGLEQTAKAASDKADQFKKQLAELVTQAREAVKQAEELAKQVSSSGDAAATQLALGLDKYAKRLDAMAASR